MLRGSGNSGRGATHAGSRDLRLRAHGARTGEVITQFDLPAGLDDGQITFKLAPDRKAQTVETLG